MIVFSTSQSEMSKRAEYIGFPVLMIKKGNKSD